MAENKGTSRGSALAVVKSAQLAVGSALSGGTASVAANDNGAAIDSLKLVNEKIADNTSEFVNTLKAMFQFDKDAFRREREGARELRKEKADEALAAGPQNILPSKEEATGGMSKLALAGIAALVAFSRELNIDDILRLPQQVKSIKGMATFAKGVGTISTLGFGPMLVDDMKAAIKASKIDPKAVTPKSLGVVDRIKEFFRPVTKMFDSIRDAMKLRVDNIKLLFSAEGSVGKIFASFKGIFSGAFTQIKTTLKPVTDTMRSIFGLGDEAGALGKLFAPLKAVGSAIGKLFLPITIIMGIFDGVSGFMKEYEETGSIVDGIRGAVVGIVDGFIGNFVRLITDLLGAALSYLGLDNLGAKIAEFGEKITGSFGEAVGGIVDFVMGIFTFDGERILSGLSSMFGGTLGFFANVLTLPIDMAVNFIKDIFGFGDPEKPFSLIDFFVGEDGIVTKAWNWFKGLFSFDFSSFKERLFNMGKIFKGLAMGGVAAAKAILPGGESPGEAFKRVYDEVVNAGNDSPNVDSVGTDDIAKTTVETVKGDVTETTYKTEQITNAGDTANNGGNMTIVDNSNKPNVQTTNNSNSTSSAPLKVVNDPYFDREAYGDAFA